MVETYVRTAFQCHPHTQAGVHHASHAAAGILPHGERVLMGAGREQMGKCQACPPWPLPSPSLPYASHPPSLQLTHNLSRKPIQTDRQPCPLGQMICLSKLDFTEAPQFNPQELKRSPFPMKLA